MVDRRKYPRFELKVDAKYSVIPFKEVFKLGSTRNISAEGICFESDEKFNIGTHVNLEVDLKDEKTPVSLIGEIRWCSEIKIPGQKTKRYVSGVKLVNIPKSDEGRFLKYYCDRMVEKLADYLKM